MLNIGSGCKKCKSNAIEMSISLGSAIKHSLEQDIDDKLKEAEVILYKQKFLNEKKIRSSIISSLSEYIHERDIEDKRHTKRLVQYALAIGERLGFTNVQLKELELIAKFHDIGKIGIREDIILKKGELTEEGFTEMKTHTIKGYKMLNTSAEMANIANSVLTHHEQYDGNGYPLGLKCEEIPLMARIISVVDAYDDMTSFSGYNEMKTKEEAILEMKRCKGTQFDPKIVDIFIEILKMARDYI